MSLVEFGIFKEKEALQELLNLVNYDFFPIAFDEMPFTFWSNREYMTDKLSLVEASTTVPNKILCIAWSYTMEHVDNPTAVETLLLKKKRLKLVEDCLLLWLLNTLALFEFDSTWLNLILQIFCKTLLLSQLAT